jgi:hypothetical protein
LKHQTSVLFPPEIKNNGTSKGLVDNIFLTREAKAYLTADCTFKTPENVQEHSEEQPLHSTLTTEFCQSDRIFGATFMTEL